VLAVAVLVLLASFAAPAAAAQSGNTTATETATATETEAPETATATATETEAPETATPDTTCTPGSNEPEMDQARLYASDTTVTQDSPGQIAGGFQVSPVANCPVVVVITMSVPSGMTIAGGSDFASSGAGLVSTRFTVRPGANIRDVRATVYSEDTGEKTVTADIQYWPEGYQDLNREIDGLSFSFNVEESTTPTSSGQSDGSQASGGSGAGGFTFVPALVAGALAALLIARRTGQ